MARPRIRQFAGDMGISYDEAKNLIEKGRRRRDGGTEVLERNMNKMHRNRRFKKVAATPLSGDQGITWTVGSSAR